MAPPHSPCVHDPRKQNFRIQDEKIIIIIIKCVGIRKALGIWLSSDFALGPVCASSWGNEHDAV